jgi:hypothetical protein
MVNDRAAIGLSTPRAYNIMKTCANEQETCDALNAFCVPSAQSVTPHAHRDKLRLYDFDECCRAPGIVRASAWREENSFPSMGKLIGVA